MANPVSFKSLFPDITDVNLFKDIEQNSKLQSFNDGDIIMDSGMPIKFIPLLLQGNIKILREDDLGNELLMYYLQPGDTCTMSLTCCMANRKSEIRAIAEGSVTMLAVPVNFMDGLETNEHLQKLQDGKGIYNWNPIDFELIRYDGWIANRLN